MMVMNKEEQGSNLGEEASSNEGLSPQKVSADEVKISQTAVDSIKADYVYLEQSGAEKVVAGELEITQGGLGRVEAQQVIMRQAGAGIVESASVDIKNGGSLIVRSQDVLMRQSGSGAVFSDALTMHSSQAGVVVGQNVQGDLIKTSILLAGQVDGPVETTLDTPRALLAGLTAGVAMGLVCVVGKLLSKR
jgi:hypothetical protein